MHPFDRSGLAWRGGPFAAAALLVFLLVPLPPSARGSEALAAFLLTAAILGTVVWLPWPRLPLAAAAVPPVAYFGVVALLRHAEGGSTTGVTVLVTLPVVWLALHGSRAQMLASVGGVAATLALPAVLLGAPEYRATEIERTILYVGVSLLIGTTVHELVTRTRDQAAELERLSLSDALTGLANRRAWNLIVPSLMASTQRDDAPLSVVVLDVDHFKPLNDSQGHAAGDRLLKQLASRWAAVVRGEDLLARYGGDEFALALPGLAAADAVSVVERLRDQAPAGASFSAGVAEWDGRASVDALLARADTALYAAKSAGRGRTAVADPDMRPRPRRAPASAA